MKVLPAPVKAALAKNGATPMKLGFIRRLISRGSLGFELPIANQKAFTEDLFKAGFKPLDPEFECIVSKESWVEVDLAVIPRKKLVYVWVTEPYGEAVDYIEKDYDARDEKNASKSGFRGFLKNHLGVGKKRQGTSACQNCGDRSCNLNGKTEDKHVLEQGSNMQAIRQHRVIHRVQRGETWTDLKPIIDANPGAVYDGDENALVVYDGPAPPIHPGKQPTPILDTIEKAYDLPPEPVRAEAEPEPPAPEDQ
jgi:hypothetical protein